MLTEGTKWLIADLPLEKGHLGELFDLWAEGDPDYKIICLMDQKDIERNQAAASTLMRSWGLTLWTFWQNVAQLQIYGTQANTLVDNAGVIQTFGARNLRMAQDLANIIGGVSAEQIMSMGADEQMLLIEGKLTRCKQARYYSDKLFQPRSA